MSGNIEVIQTVNDGTITAVQDTCEIILQPVIVRGGEGGGAVDSVNGKIGEVVLDKSDIGLDEVDNTSDADKPISDATQLALDDKADSSELDTLKPKNTDDIGAIIPLDTVGCHLCNFEDANDNTAFTLDNTDDILNAWAQVLINTSTEPTITGATQQGGIEWVADTDLYLIVRNIGIGVVYYYVSNAISSGSGGGIESIVAGTNVTVDNTDPLNPIVNASGDAPSNDPYGVSWDNNLDSASKNALYDVIQTITATAGAPIGNVEEGDVNATSGDTVYNFTSVKTLPSISDLNSTDYSTYELIGGYRSNTGDIVINSNYSSTPLIEVKHFQVLKYTARTAGGAVMAITSFDENEDFIEVLLAGVSDDIERTVIVPKGVSFISFSSGNSYPRDFAVENYVVDGQYVNLDSKLLPYKTIENYDIDVNDKLEEDSVNIIPFDWLSGAFADSAIYNDYALNSVPSTKSGLIKEITYQSSSNISTIHSIAICTIVEDTVTILEEIALRVDENVTVEVDAVNDKIYTYTLLEDIYIEEGQYLAIKALNFVFTTGATDITPYTYTTATSLWTKRPSNYGYFYNFTVDYIEQGIKNKLQNLDSKVTEALAEPLAQNSIKQAKLELVNAYSYNFSEPTTDWTINSWTVSSDVATTNTTGDKLTYGKKYVSSKRLARSIVTLKSNTVLRFGTSPTLNVGNETSVIVNAVTSKIEIYQKNGTATVIASADIPTIVEDREYVLELERYETNTTFRMIDNLSGDVYEVNYDFINGNHYNTGAGNHINYYYFTLVSGDGVSVKSLDIFLPKSPFIVFAGDSITESNGRCKVNYAEQLLDYYGQDGLIVARSAAGTTVLGDMLTNEIAFIKPKYLSVMIGTNGGGNTVQYQSIIDFCDSNGIELILNRITAILGGADIVTNETIAALDVQGARFDIATSLNYDILDGYNPDFMDDGTHPNQDGNDRMVMRFYLDLPIVRKI